MFPRKLSIQFKSYRLGVTIEGHPGPSVRKHTSFSVLKRISDQHWSTYIWMRTFMALREFLKWCPFHCKDKTFLEATAGSQFFMQPHESECYPAERACTTKCSYKWSVVDQCSMVISLSGKKENFWWQEGELLVARRRTFGGKNTYWWRIPLSLLGKSIQVFKYKFIYYF